MRVFGRRGSEPAAATSFHGRREPRFVQGRSGGAVPRGMHRDRLGSSSLAPEVAFLCGHGVPDDVVRRTCALADMRGTNATDELFASGFDRRLYWSLLAEHLGLPFAPDLTHAKLVARWGSTTADAVRLASSVLVEIDGRTILVVAPQGDNLAALKARLKGNGALAERVIIAAPESIRAFLVAHRHSALTHYAVNRLARVLPRLSARHLLRPQPVQGPMTLAAACVAMGLLATTSALNAITLALTVFFVNCGAWKTMAALRRPRPLRLEPVPEGRLPTYTVLVPLHREAAVVADLFRNLRALDYPALCINSTKRNRGR